MKGKKLKTKKKKTLVVFYSRTGNTRKVGKEIAENLKADVCEIYSNSNYKGIFGYIKAGYQAIKNKKPLIKFDKNSDDYDLIVIGTPNWGSKMASPVRTFVYGRKFKKAAYFCLQGGSGGEKLLDEFDGLCGKAVVRLIVNDRELKNESYKTKIKWFCEKLK